MAKVSWTHLSRGVTEVRIELSGCGDTARLLLTSDAHLDNTHCDRDMMRSHLEMLEKDDCYWIDNGDMFCAMQGKYDRRSDRSQLMPEFQGNEYLDSISRYAADFVEPYAKRCILLGRGNHETAILKHCQTDLTERLVGSLNDRVPDARILAGGYGGWILLRLTRDKQRKTFRIFRHHGFGGAAPVTKGVIHTARMSGWLPDADIVILGHTHSEFVVPIARQRINNAGVITYDEQLFLRIPGYKNGLQDNYEGWEVEKGFSPTTTGAFMLDIGWRGWKDKKRVDRFEIEPRRLK